MIQFCLNKLKKNPDQLFGYFILFMKLNYEVPILVTQNSGELRNGSSLHAGFYDLILFFPVSSFILILDRCV